MAFQLKGDAFQIRSDLNGHYSTEWAIGALKLINLVIGLIIWAILTFDICYYLGLMSWLIDPALVPANLLELTAVTIVLAFIPIVINRVAIADLSTTANKPSSMWDIVTGDGVEISLGTEDDYGETHKKDYTHP